MQWKRWGAWCAHLYEGDRTACHFAGGNFRRGVMLGKKPGQLVTLEGSAIGPHGVPFGRTCVRCLKVFNGAR